MTLEELFKKLSYGELSNLVHAVDGGAIKKDKQNQVLNFVNEGLLRLHTRFPLIQSEEFVTMTGAEMTHPFPSADVLQLLSIVTAYGESLTFGNQSVPGTLFVHERIIYFPVFPTGLELQLTYQKRHPVLDEIEADADLQQVVDLQEELHEALTAYVAAKLFGNIQTPEARISARSYGQRFNEVIAEAMQAGVLPGEILTGSKFETRGWA